MVEIRSDLRKEINITSGIRQGCTGSTTLFKLLTYIITSKIEEKGKGFMNEMFKISALFYADDGMLSES